MPRIGGFPDMNVIYVNTNLSGVYLKRFLDPNNTTAVQHEVTRNLTHLILGAATKNTKFGINDSTIDPNKKNPLLIPVFRAALPMYVVAQTAFPEADTALVLCTKNKRMVGKNSVEINWMGRKAFATESDLDGKDILLMDTVIATGDTILTLLDDMKATIEAIEVDSMECHRRVTVLTCFASPQALAKLKGHPLVDSVVVGAVADSVDQMGFLIPSTGGDMGDKLFGEKAER